MTFEEFVERTNSAQSGEEVFRVLCEAAGAFGFDYIAYFLLTDHPALGQGAGFCIEGAKDGHDIDVHFHDADSECSRTFAGENGFHQAYPFHWPWLEHACRTKLQQKIAAHDGAQGLHDGLGIPIHGANGALAGVVLASTEEGRAMSDPNSQSRLMALAMQFHLAYAGHEGTNHGDKPVSLTPREREVLLWAAEGKSDGVISDIIGITVPTVRFHLQNTFRKLDTNDRTLAVLKAMRQGLITPSYGSTSEN